MSDAVVLRFCDLCGVSIPQKDLDSGLTRAVGERLVGACCLAKIMPPLGSATPPPSPLTAKAGGPALLAATLVLLAGMAAAVWYLDKQGAERAPATAIAGLQGRVDGMSDLVSKLEERQRLAADVMVRDTTAAISAKFAALEAQMEKVRAAIPDPGKGIDTLQARVAELKERIGDLAGRQGAIESQLAKSLNDVREELDKVDRSVNDLRRQRVAAGPAADSSGPAKAESLPEALGRKVDQLGNDDPGVRWSAVDELVRSGNKKVIPYILPALKDKDPFVRRLVAEGLASLGEESTCGPLIDALEDVEAIVREAAYKSLVKLSSKKLPFDPEAKADARKAAAQKWRQWWDARSKG